MSNIYTCYKHVTNRDNMIKQIPAKVSGLSCLH